MAVPKPNPRAKATSTPKLVEKWPFGRKNYIWFGIALLTMVLGYVLLSQGSITWAPLLLVIAYCVLMPVAILVKDVPKSDAPIPPTEPLA